MTNKKTDVVTELVTLIKKGNAHVPLTDAVADLPAELRGKKVRGLPYSIWQLVDHLRFTQWDIVEFSTAEGHESPEWPAGYWSEHITEVSDELWNGALQQIAKDQERFFKLLKDRADELLQPFPWGSGQSLFREAVLIADHNAYHVGEIIVLRRLLDAWE
ncbi:DinB family protein [Chitinophaga horti]|uniref:DinB family protein n=1 Tax=Chitinophaga horti TaxID=2920382 RepID=A0ABY6J4F6_9BACT|nr:DinB family protein [Chitinophaga horti]UYQ94560.1 DinB family protein [Chitinophaga horti]